MNKRIAVFGLALLVSGMVAVGVGCGGSDTSRPPPEALKEGVTVFSASQDVGVSGAFKRGSEVVYFDTRRGAMRPDLYQAEFPELGEHEHDARFLDANGNAIVLARGGDAWIDPTWATDLHKQELAKVVVAGNAADLAAEAATAIAAHPFPVEVAHHQAALSVLGTGHAKLGASAPKKVGGDAQYGNFTWSGTASYEIHYKGIICAAWICGGQHSSVKVTTGGGAVYYSANHGGFPYSSGMGSVSCRGSGSGGWFQAEEQTSLADSNNGGCTTPYSWNAGSGYHNCHSDSMMEGYGVTYYQESTNAGVCSGLNWWYAPGNSGHPCPN